MGEPEIVIVLLAHKAVTPVGSPLAVPIPVAPVVVWVIGVIAVWIQSVGEYEAALTVCDGVTFIVPLAMMLSQPPNKGIS